MQKNKDEILNQYKGCLIGLALGDVLGMPFEFWQKDAVAKHFSCNDLSVKDFFRGGIKFPAGFYSDDTAMTICLAESLLEKDFNLDDQFERYHKWYQYGYATPSDSFSYGVGQQTLRALTQKIDFNKMDGLDERGGGNGSLMRCAPIGLHYHGDIQEIKDKSLLASYITHNYHIAGWSCVILNAIITLIIEGCTKDVILSKVSSTYGNLIPGEIKDVLNLEYDKIDDYCYPVSGYSVDTLRIAIWSWMTSENYLESIKKVILLGNDTDTFGAVTGAITGCYWGYDLIPDVHRSFIMKQDYIVKLAEKLYANNSRKK